MTCVHFRIRVMIAIGLVSQDTGQKLQLINKRVFLSSIKYRYFCFNLKYVSFFFGKCQFRVLGTVRKGTIFETKAVFESTENHFRKSFSVKSMRLVAMENRFSGKSFPFDQNFTLLTRKSFYIVVLPSNDFRRTRKREREPQKEKTHANKTHSARERENDRRWSRSWSPEPRRSRSRDRDRRDCDRDLADQDRDLTEKMWSFLGFICIFRNEWYYLFVW